MIRSVKIENFKCLDQLELPDLGRITLIGGKNGSGKTSVLEALALLLKERRNPSLINLFHRWQGAGTISLAAETLVQPAFTNYDLSKVISLSARFDDGLEESLTLRAVDGAEEAVIRSLPSGTAGRDGSRTTSIKSDPAGKPIAVLELDSRKTGGVPLINRLVIDSDGVKLGPAHDQTPEFPLAYFRTMVLLNPGEEADRLSRLVFDDRQNEVFDIVKNVEPALKELLVLSPAGFTTVYADIGLKRKIPARALGEGFARVLDVALTIPFCAHGVILIDEAENGLHHSVQEKAWRAIIQAAVKNDCQIIATSHSYEFINNIHSALDEEFEKEFRYIRLDKGRAGLSPKTSNSEMFCISAENRWEVR